MQTLNANGWIINLSKETLQKKPVPPSTEHLKDLQPSDKSFYYNFHNTNLMLSNIARSHPTHPIDQAQLVDFLSKHHPSASNISEIPEHLKKYYLVREIWVGNISPVTVKRTLYDKFRGFGDIETIEMFSSKGFAFIKFRKVVAATRAYEFGDATLIDGRSLKVAFADPSRRFDIVGDSLAPEGPNFKPIDDESIKNIFLGHPSAPHLISPSVQPSVKVSFVNNPISKSEPNHNLQTTKNEPNLSLGTVVWSGFMTRSKNYRVGIDATLVQGNDDCFPSALYHVNVSHRVQFSEITKFYILALVIIEASNETQQDLFSGYVKYFSEKQRAGYIAMKSSVLYICPPIDEAKKIYPELKDTQLLGVFVDPQRKAEKAKDPQLEEIMNLLKNPEAMKHFNTLKQYLK
jgi:RNA recognition motif-containing protein